MYTHGAAIRVKNQNVENKISQSTKAKLQSKSNKKIYLEILRCIAIFFVIFNHTGNYGFKLYAITDNKFLHVIYLTLANICTMAVPIFFMISGALLLNKEEDIKTLYKKRVLRIVLVILLASFVQYIYSIKADFATFNLLTFFKMIYSKNIITPYWYLYSYLAFLIMLPFLRNMVKNMKKEEYYYLFTIYIVYKMIMPIFTQAFNINISGYLQIAFIGNNIIYPILGYFCENILEIEKISKKIIIVATIVLVAIFACGDILTILEIAETGKKDVTTYVWYGQAFFAVYTYMGIKYIFYKRELPNWLNKIILTVGGCSFRYVLDGGKNKRSSF